MRGTLSHRCPQLGHCRRPDPRAGPVVVAVLAVALTTIACNRLDTDRAGEEAGRARAADAATADRTSKPADPFSWPEDPSHPVLEIAIEGPNAEGRLLVELMPELAPATVNHVLELATEGFYDGTTFHRVIPGFMIQGGDPNSRDRDPTNDGRGASGHKLNDEFSDAPFVRGVVGMGNKGRPNSTSSQFFIMQQDNRNLDGRYTAIGRVIDGMALVDRISEVKIDKSGRWGPKDRPIENVVMTRIRSLGPRAEIAPPPETGKGDADSAADDADSRSRARFSDAASESQSAGEEAPETPPAAPDGAADWQRLEAFER